MASPTNDEGDRIDGKWSGGAEVHGYVLGVTPIQKLEEGQTLNLGFAHPGGAAVLVAAVLVKVDERGVLLLPGGLKI